MLHSQEAIRGGGKVELAAALEKFLKDRSRRCTPRIVEWYSSHIRMFLDWLAAQNVTDIEAVTLDHLEQFAANLRERDQLRRPGKMSPVTIKQRMSALATFFRWAFKLRLIVTDPSAELKLPKLARRLPKSLTPDQVKVLLGAQMSTRERAALCLILDSGLRLSEAANLELQDLDLARGVAHVRHGKGDKERYVVFGADARAALEAWLHERYASFGETEIFLGQKGKLGDQGLYKLIKKVANRAGVKLYPHMLRHTFATQYLDAGGSLVDLRDLLGHTDIRTTTIYIGVSLERLCQKHKTLSPLSRMATERGDGTASRE
jgi:site-specific recombinase XerD